MDPKPRIFISTVSKELRSARQLVANTLTFLGFEPVWQDVFGAEQGDLSEVLRRKIADCDGLVQLVGQRFGFGPMDPAKDPAAISYTQFELLYARQIGKKVWPVLLTPDFRVDERNDESEAMRENQQRYRHRLEQGGDLYQNADDLSAVETIVLKLRQPLEEIREEWEKERRRAVRFRVLVGTGVVLLIGAAAVGLQLGWWIKKDTARTAEATSQTDKKLDAVLEHNQKMEQALAKLADAEIHARELGPKLTPDQLRQRAYAILDNDLGMPAGTLEKQLPGFALEMYNRADTSPLARARAAYALNKFAEAEQLFVESAQQESKAPVAAEKARTQRMKAMVGAGESARARVQYDRALEHFRAAAEMTSKDRDFSEWLAVQNRIGWVLSLMGKYREEEKHMAGVWSECEKAGKTEMPLAQSAHRQWATALTESGDPRRAEAEFRKLLPPVGQGPGGHDEPDLLATRNDLANALLAEGKGEEAEAEYRALLKIWERTAEPDNPDVLAIRDNLANALYVQEKFPEAAAAHRAVLTLRERVLGREHPDTLASKENWAAAMESMGKSAEAEEIHRDVLQARERVLGAEHPDTLMARMNLANSEMSQGRHAQAARELRSTLDSMERVLGAEHPTTLMAEMNFGNALAGMERHAEAEREFRTVLRYVPQSIAEESTTALLARTGVAHALFSQEKYTDAEPEFRTVLRLREHALGPNHPDTLATLYSLALDLNRQHRNGEARPLAKRAADGARITLGAENESTKLYQDFLRYLSGEE